MFRSELYPEHEPNGKYAMLVEGDPMLDSYQLDPFKDRDFLAEYHSFCMSCLSEASRIQYDNIKMSDTIDQRQLNLHPALTHQKSNLAS